MATTQINEILLRIKKVFEMLDLEIMRCEMEIDTRNAIIKGNSGFKKVKYQRRVLNAKIEREKFEIARDSYIDLQKQIRNKIDSTIAITFIGRDLVVDFLTHSDSIDDVASRHKMKPSTAETILDSFSKTLCKRLKYIKFNEYFDI